MKQLLEAYFIMGTQDCPTNDPLAVLEQALEGGITLFQFREKGPEALSGLQKEQFAKKCQQLCRSFNVPFIVNDDIQLALRIDADGVHVGQDDMASDEVRRLLGPEKIIGVSAHSNDEVLEAIAQQANYVGIGPIYQTTSKADADAPAGTTMIEEARRAFPDIPIVAIGGITIPRSEQPIAAGADGVSVISAIAQASSPKRAAEQLKEAVQRAKAKRDQ